MSDVEGSFVWLAALKTWTVTLVLSLIERETQDGHRQYLFENIKGSMHKLTMNQLSETVRGFVNYWSENELLVSRNGSLIRVL